MKWDLASVFPLFGQDVVSLMSVGLVCLVFLDRVNQLDEPILGVEGSEVNRC
jgi:hypothetical protein